MKYALSAVYFFVAATNFLVASLYFGEGSDGLGILWSVSAGLWLGGGIIWATIARNE